MFSSDVPGRVYPRIASTNDRIKSRRHRGRWWRRWWFPRRRSRRLGLRFHSETTKQGDDALRLLLSPPPENIFQNSSLQEHKTRDLKKAVANKKKTKAMSFALFTLLFTRQISGSARASLSLKCALQSNKVVKTTCVSVFLDNFVKTLNLFFRFWFYVSLSRN